MAALVPVFQVKINRKDGDFVLGVKVGMDTTLMQPHASWQRGEPVALRLRYPVLVPLSWCAANDHSFFSTTVIEITR